MRSPCGLWMRCHTTMLSYRYVGTMIVENPFKTVLPQKDATDLAPARPAIMYSGISRPLTDTSLSGLLAIGNPLTSTGFRKRLCQHSPFRISVRRSGSGGLTSNANSHRTTARYFFPSFLELSRITWSLLIFGRTLVTPSGRCEERSAAPIHANCSPTSASEYAVPVALICMDSWALSIQELITVPSDNVPKQSKLAHAVSE